MKQIPFFCLLFSLTFVKNTLFAQSVVANEATNLLYVGVDNPLTIIAQGVPPEALEVRISEGTITKMATNVTDYVAKVNKSGKVKIETWHQGKKLEEIEFRVKKIPDPYVRLDLPRGSCSGGGSKLTDAKKMVAVLENFNFDATCEVVFFHFSYVPKKGETIELDNKGASFSAEVINQIKNANPGDVVYFDKVKTRCPGDTEGREVNSLLFKIK